MVEQPAPGQMMVALEVATDADAEGVKARVMQSVRQGLAGHGLAAQAIGFRIGR